MSTFTKALNGFLPISPFKFAKLVKYLKLVQQKNVKEVDRLQPYFFHPELTYVVGGNGRISGVYQGWPEYRDKIILGEISTPGKIVNITTSRDSVTLFTHLEGSRNEKILDLDVVFLFRFSGSRLIEGRSLPYDTKAWDMFWE